MIIKTESKTVKISFRKWIGGWDAGYTPDCFDDLEVMFSNQHERNDDGYVLASDDELSSLISWWQEEANAANNGEDGETMQALSEDEIERGDEWVLFVDEEV